MDSKSYLDSLNKRFIHYEKLMIALEDVSDKNSFDELSKELMENIFFDKKKHEEFVRSNGYLNPIEKVYNDLSYCHFKTMNFFNVFRELKF